jgi:transmembrane sensor
MNAESMNIERIKELIISYLTGELTNTEQQELVSLIKQDPKNQELFDKMLQTWHFAGTLKKSGREESNRMWKRLLSVDLETGKPLHELDATIPVHKLSRNVRRIISIAAAVFFIFFSGSLVTYLLFDKSQPKLTSQLFQVVTPNGTRSELTLADGTQVWLNAGSKLTYAQDYNFNERSVNLSGEAFFQVKTDKNKPFVVHSSGLSIKALGTSFNVKAYPEDRTLVATLVEGKLVIEGKTADQKRFNYTLAPKQNLVFTKTIPTSEEINSDSNIPENTIAKSKREFKPDIKSASLESDVNTALYTSWKDSRWVIERESFINMATMLERRYDVKIIYEPEDLRDIRFTGIIENETLEQILRVIQLSAPIRYEFEKGAVHIVFDRSIQERYFKAKNN